MIAWNLFLVDCNVFRVFCALRWISFSNVTRQVARKIAFYNTSLLCVIIASPKSCEIRCKKGMLYSAIYLQIVSRQVARKIASCNISLRNINLSTAMVFITCNFEVFYIIGDREYGELKGPKGVSFTYFDGS